MMYENAVRHNQQRKRVKRVKETEIQPSLKVVVAIMVLWRFVFEMDDFMFSALETFVHVWPCGRAHR